jgi:hypothetical protein
VDCTISFLPFVFFLFASRERAKLNTALRSRGHESVMGRFLRPINGKSLRRGGSHGGLGTNWKRMAERLRGSGHETRPIELDPSFMHVAAGE